MVLERLQHDAATRQIPVVLVSADTSKAIVTRTRELGAVAHLGKPINADQLSAVVSRLLDRRSAVVGRS